MMEPLTPVLINQETLLPSLVAVEDVLLDGEPVVRVAKNVREHEYGLRSCAVVPGCDFRNGVIEVDVRSRILPDAPDLARGFIGIAFRVPEIDGPFECFYLRPANGRCDDPERRTHAVEYFSYPNYTFAYFRAKGITKYEAPADICLDEWIHVRIEVDGTKGKLYTNGVNVLSVEDMKGRADAKGSIALFVDIGTEGFFKNLKVSHGNEKGCE